MWLDFKAGMYGRPLLVMKAPSAPSTPAPSANEATHLRTVYVISRGAGMHEPSIYWGPWKLTLLLTSLLVVAYSLLMIATVQVTGRDWPLQVSIISMIWLAVYLGSTFLQFKTAYLLTTSYVIMLVLFHLGITIPDAFGIFKEDVWHAGPSESLELSGWCTVLAMGSLGCGFAIGLKKRDFTIDRRIVQQHTADRTLRILYSDGIGLLIASGVLLVLAIASLGNLLNYSRGDFFRSVGDTRGLGVFLLSFPSAVVALVIGATTPGRRRFAAVIAVFGVAIILMSGYRATAMFPLLVGIVLWVKIGRRISAVLLLATLAFTLVAISAIGIMRNFGHAYKDIDAETISISVRESTVQDAFSTMGQTGGLLAEVIRLVPAHDPFRFGQSYWLAFKSSIPNVLPGMRESPREKGKREAQFDIDAINKMMPSDWLTYRLEPDKFDVGEGVGFTGIGEPYLNFGYPGVVVFFVGLGFYFSRLEVARLLERPGLLVYCSTIVWLLITTVRQESSNFIRPAVFVFIIIFAWRIARRLFLVARQRAAT
jgi:hypothetical protein